jgi:hypothetical protein
LPSAESATFKVGDTVELRDAAFDTVGDGHMKVEWNTGTGLMGKTPMLSVRALRRQSAD